jgi:hypothetical protein
MMRYEVVNTTIDGKGPGESIELEEGEATRRLARGQVKPIVDDEDAAPMLLTSEEE